MDDSHLVICSESGGQLATYYGEDMQIYYKMINPTKYANDNFYMRWAHLNTSDVIKPWCQEPTKFRHHPSTVYQKKVLRNIYQYLIGMYCRLYGCKNVEVLKENWIYMLNMVVTCD